MVFENNISMIPAKLSLPISYSYNDLILDEHGINLIRKHDIEIYQRNIEFMLVDNELNHIFLRNIISAIETSADQGLICGRITFMTFNLGPNWQHYMTGA